VGETAKFNALLRFNFCTKLKIFASIAPPSQSHPKLKKKRHVEQKTYGTYIIAKKGTCQFVTCIINLLKFNVEYFKFLFIVLKIS